MATCLLFSLFSPGRTGGQKPGFCDNTSSQLAETLKNPVSGILMRESYYYILAKLSLIAHRTFSTFSMKCDRHLRAIIKTDFIPDRIMVALPDRTLMTAEEYLAWEPTQEERYEYWDGEIVAISGATRNHNRICLNFFKLLDESLNLPYEIYILAVKVRVEGERNYFYPDVMVTCDEHDKDPDLVQFPCLIIEVLSPATEAVDRGIKFAKYRQFSTLQEYVLVQVQQPGVEMFRRDRQGQWVLSEYNLGDSLQLESVGVEIAIGDLYRQIQFS